jgi:C4-dicarboxylate-specific signal transduction histidine kinase
MNNFFTSKSHLYLLLTTLLVGIFFIGGLGIKTAHELGTATKKMYEDPLLGNQYAADISINTQKSKILLGYIAYSGDKASLENYIKQLLELGKQTEEKYKFYETTINEEENKKNYDDLKLIRKEYLLVRDKLIELARQSKYDEAKALFGSTQVITKYDNQSDKILHYNEKHAKEFYDVAQVKTSSSVKILTISFIPILLITLMVSIIINKIFSILNKQNKQLEENNIDLEAGYEESVVANNMLIEQATQLVETNEELSAAKEELQALLNEQEELVIQETEKRLEAERIMAQQAKLASLGDMISNVAHQWRQPLNSLGLNIQDIEMANRFGELNDEYLKEFRQDSMAIIGNMSKTIDDFREFFKPNKIKEDFVIQKAVGLGLSIVNGALETFHIQVKISQPQEELMFFGYKNELSQVVASILSNSKEAVAKIDSDVDRRIDIEISKDEHHIKISITDNGGGIPDDIIEKVFEPYFTTKHKAQGVGLSLYTAKIIIEQNMDGRFDVHNTDDGACFVIELPLSK